MIKLFKQNNIAQLLIILGVALGLWMRAFIAPIEPMASTGFVPLYDVIFSWLVPHPMLSTILAFLLLLLEGLWLNTLLYNYKLVTQSTMMPMLFYVAAMSYDSSQLTMTPLLVANVAVLGATNQLLVQENLVITFDNIFNASMLIAVASLFYLPCVVLLIPLVIVFTIHNLYRWRHWMMLLLGFVAPYIIVATYYFLTDRLYYVAYLTRSDIFNFHVNFGQVTTMTAIANSAFLLLVFVSLMSLLSSVGEHVAMFRKNVGVITLLLLAAVLMLFYQQLFPVNPQSFAIPFALLGTCYFMAVKKKVWIYNIVLILFIVLAFL